MNDPAFLQSVLEGLPGVDTQSEAIKNAMGALTNKQESDKKDDKKKDDKKWTKLFLCALTSEYEPTVLHTDYILFNKVNVIEIFGQITRWEKNP